MNIQTCKVLISGAGPCGLAAAMMLIERGWQDIVIVERRGAADEYERGKAFNYQLDGRGQRILDRVGIDASTLERYGLPNERFTQVVFNADGTHRQNSFPALLPGRKTPYWMTRNRLLEMLQHHLEISNTSGAVTIHYGATLLGIKRNTGENGEIVVDVQNADGALTQYKPRLILACDGLRSAVRQSLKALSEEDEEATQDFSMHKHASPSAELGYKVLNFPASFKVAGSDREVNDHTLAYCFMSRQKEPGKRMALFALPVPHANEPRNINVILHRTHELWQLQEAAEIESWLKDSFPQLDFDDLLAENELSDFASLQTGYFPEPQYAGSIHFAVGGTNVEAACDVLLLGDASRAFPPDLGMGVNAALEDVFILDEILETCDGQLRSTCETYEARRLPENRSLVRLVQSIHPYQYNQVPWRLKLWFLKFLCQRFLNRFSRGLIPEPPFVLVQKHLLSFCEIERRARRANLAFYGTSAVVILLVGLLT